MAWNVVFNGAFERWESRQAKKARSLRRPVAHAVGFEAGLIVLLLPPFAWILGVGLWQAFLLEVGLMLFFLAYAVCFNWAFDLALGPPASASPPRRAPDGPAPVRSTGEG